jgi:predicted nucleotidyltransferase
MLAKLLGSKLRAKVLSWLFLHPDQRFFGRQLEELLHEDSTNISRELARLAKLGILAFQVEGRQKYYRANRESPIFSELQGLVIKTAGLVDVLREALEPLSKKIRVAFVHGSFAKGTVKPDSDVDLIVIGSCRFGEVVDAINEAQDKLGREVNPTVYPLSEWREKLASGNHFVCSVSSARDKIFIMGNKDDLAGLA